MDGRRWHEDHAEASLPHPTKRQKNGHDDLDNAVHESRNRSLPLPDEYTIAWICALHIEMAAARAMLDEVHKDPPWHRNDTNAYTLGTIEHHNVVIACLPTTQYGTNNAANVLTHLVRTFPSIRLGLMVGIGGGVPSMADIRLGDIVVGTRVMQYDLGKILGDGQIQSTAIPKIPQQLLGTIVSSLRAKHELEPSRIPSILREKFKGHSEYGRPSSPDYLFRATYAHVPSTASCDGCDHSKLVSRSRRLTNDPLIHYGAIASGNQVMRSGTVRDKIARQEDVVCFEMEAAGLMDILPCLPIRGICDYSDSHKNKEWQRYAAAAAAAYARELLAVIPVAESHTNAAYVANSHRDICDDNRRRLLDSLRFDQMDSRKSTIRTAHNKTCRWFLDHTDYQAWLDTSKWTQHHGFLWISGKPGAGKSTIMKFAYSNMKSKARLKHSITASFFFNARGEYLERSIVGMYRSLLLQLLEGYPDLQTVLDDPDLVLPSQNGCPCLNALKELFCNAVSALGQRSFTCFIDALDECDEQQVIDMVQYFEDLAEQSTNNSIALRICFSSRHYPYITIRRGIRLTLEDQPGHAEDLANYVASRLQIKEPALVEELQSQLLEKADGVFLWIVLVVDILNQEYGRGGLALRKRLAEIPSDLSKLFTDVLRRDNEGMEDLLLCILWILCAKRPLRPMEFYHALWTGLSLKGMADPEIPNVTGQAARDRVNRFVISSSKGLAKITKSKQPSVQFIHESVRDFLVKDKGLHKLWPDIGFDWESPGHERLKQCCNSYMNHSLVRAKLLSEAKSNRRTEISREYPFLEYASEHVLHHANAAANAVHQDEFLSRFPVSNWISIINLFDRFKIHEYSPDASLFYILAERGLSQLIRTRLKEDSRSHCFGEKYGYPLFAALANGNKDAVAALLNSPSSICNGLDVTDGMKRGTELNYYKDLTPLSWAAQDGWAGIVKLLLQRVTAIDDVDRGGRTPLSRASENGHEEVARLLIDKGADVKASAGDGWSPLLLAVEHGHEAVVRLLIDKGADIKAINKCRWTPLSLASQRGHEAVVRLLIDKGADIKAIDKCGWTPLLFAAENGYEAVVRLLIDEGADVEASTEIGWSPLIQASQRGHEAVVRLLIDKGADIKTINKYGWTPLLFAAENGHRAVVRLLIDEGADVEASTENGWSPLIQASQRGYEAVVRLLIDKGADIKAIDKCGWTPLLFAVGFYREAVVRLLIDEGVDVEASTENGWSPLILASQRGHEAVVRLLINKGADIKAIDKRGWTPLLFAAENGHGRVARLLIDEGADVEASAETGWSPLLLASQGGHEAVTRLLLEKGANVEVIDSKYGRTSLLLAAAAGWAAGVKLLLEKGADVNATDKDGQTALLWAAANGYDAVVKHLIATEKVDLDSEDDNGQTALSWAAANTHEHVVKLLLATERVNPDSQDNHNRTPLLWVVKSAEKQIEMKDKGGSCLQDYQMQLMLLEQQNKKRLMIAHQGQPLPKPQPSGMKKKGNSCLQDYQMQLMLLEQQNKKRLMMARQTEHLQTPRQHNCPPGASFDNIVKMLLAKGANVDARDGDGRTPLSHTVEKGHEAIVKILLENGANVHVEDNSGRTPLSYVAETGHGAIAKLLQRRYR